MSDLAKKGGFQSYTAMTVLSLTNWDTFFFWAYSSHSTYPLRAYGHNATAISSAKAAYPSITLATPLKGMKYAGKGVFIL